MIDSNLFKLMVEKQKEWRKQYNESAESKRIIRTIYNRKYRSKGNKELEEIRKSLMDIGILEEIQLIDRHSGELCFEALYGR